MMDIFTMSPKELMSWHQTDKDMRNSQTNSSKTVPVSQDLTFNMLQISNCYRANYRHRRSSCPCH